MKIFVCYCCLEDTDSTNEFVIKEFINGIKNYSQGEVNVFFANLLNYNIEFCNGSVKPFETGESQCPDDMLILEKEILNSDFVILSSPVYGNNVSGATKVFLDRITHLESIAESLGLSIVAKSSFITNEQTREVIKNILHTKALLAMSKVNSNEFIISERQEREFQQYKIMFNEGKGGKNEISYWTKKHMFESQSLREHLYRSIE